MDLKIERLDCTSEPRLSDHEVKTPPSGRPAAISAVRGQIPGDNQSFFEVTETVPAVIFIHRDGRFVYINSWAEQILGYSKEEFLTMDFWDVVHPQCRQLVRDRGLRRQQGENVPTRYRLKAITKGGGELWLECSARQTLYAGCPAVLGCAFDITDRARAEERLAVQYRVAQILSEADTLQQAASRVLGAVAEGVGWNYGALWTPESAGGPLRCRATWHGDAAALDRFDAVCLERNIADVGLPGRAWAQQRAVWIPDLRLEREVPRALAAEEAGLRSAAAFPVLIENRLLGVIEYFAGEVRELNDDLLKLMRAIGPQIGQLLERKRTEDALRESENRFALFMRHLPGAAWMKDTAGRYLYANETAERIFGVGRSDLSGKTDNEIFPVETAAQFKQNDLSAIQSGRGVQFVETLRQGDGVHHSIVSKFPILDEAGVPVMVGGVAIDISERVKAERLSAAFSELGQQLSVATTRLEAARIIVDIAATVLNWDACYLHLATPDLDKLIPVLTMDTVDGRRLNVPPETFTLDPSPMMLRVMKDGAQRVDREADSTPPGLVPFGDTSRPSAAMLYVPIRSGSKVIGILSIQSYTPRAYRDEDLGTLQTLADHGGGALQRIHMAEALREMEARNHVLLNAIPDWIFRIRQDGTLIDCRIQDDDARASYFQRFIGHKLAEVLPGTIGQEAMVSIGRTLEDGAPGIFEFQHPSGGAVHDYEARIQVAAPDEVLVIVRDFSERTRLEREVLAASAQERHRIGKDLHDGLGQLLTGLGYLAKALEEKLSLKGSEEKADAGRLSRLVVQALTQTRDLARGLFPVELETKGLIAALNDLAASTQNLYGISCCLQCESAVTIPDRTAQEHLYRLAQEAINNAVRHGKAREVTVSLTSPESGRLLLVVRDNGAGFTRTPAGASGMGLRTMEYRARAIGGELVVQSPPRGGTVVSCLFPI